MWFEVRTRSNSWSDCDAAHPRCKAGTLLVLKMTSVAGLEGARDAQASRVLGLTVALIVRGRFVNAQSNHQRSLWFELSSGHDVLHGSGGALSCGCRVHPKLGWIGVVLSTSTPRCFRPHFNISHAEQHVSIEYSCGL